MEFLKKNWLKITASVILSVGLIFALIVVFKGVQTDYYTSLKSTGLEGVDPAGLWGPASTATDGFSGNLARVDFFIAFASAMFLLGALIFVVCSMFEKTKCIKNWALLACGILATTFVIIAFANALPYMSKLTAYADAMKNFANTAGAETALTGYVPNPAAAIEGLKAGANQIYDQVQSGVFNRIVTLIIFGLTPIMFAVKKLLCKNKLDKA